MSTQFYTQDQPATSQQDTGHYAPRPHRGGSSWFRIAAIIIGTVVAAALIVLAATGLTRSHPAQTPAPGPPAPSPLTRPSRPPRPPTRPSRRPRPSPRRRRSKRCSSSSAS
jgi:hypothetical protein